MSMNNRQTYSLKPKLAPPWEQVWGEGGKSRFPDEKGNDVFLPGSLAWRPPGWPALSLSYARSCGQPNAERLAAARPRHRRHQRPVVDVDSALGVV